MLLLVLVSFVMTRTTVKGKFTDEELKILKDEFKDCTIQVKKEDVQDLVDCMEGRLEIPNDMKDIMKKLDKMREETPISQIKAGRRTFFVFFADQLTSEQKQEIMRVKEDDIFYFMSSNKQLAKDMNVQFPGVYAFNSTENASYKVKLDGSYGAVMAPIFTVLTTDAIKYIDDSKMPAFYIFYSDGQDKQLRSELKTIAFDRRSQYKFGMLKYIPGRTDLNHFKVQEEQLPALVHLVDGKKYRLVNVTKENLTQFIGDYEQSLIPPFVRSEPAPEVQKDLVKVVGTTHNDFIRDEVRDTLLVYGSETCPHCVKLLPTIEKLAEKTKNNNKVKVGYVNMYENDVPDVNIKAFPTIILYGAGHKEPLEYKEFSRTEEDFINFIKNSGSLNVDLNETGQNVDEKDLKDEDTSRDLDKKIEEVKSEIKEKIEGVKEEL